ncbi:sugar phosphate isomerase/epimerase family protein [Cryptosporangium aurantiacum]|uniref:Sugar phosphate isomerase/epimerase n=1 Tax=Cryptosporangium aurantiacum TaxID=134849 RepID=A0A1M7RN84_9ACTN|nr:sugar phosphate isomerase/epimerase family protein [Cryptosporangium aurantiacum]SHN47763.1 Sugar phosphate isomerase/epimerase [Cryptosporangium aurantiacum]
MSLSLNQKTINRASLAEAVDACARAGIEAIGVWREPLADVGVERGAKLVRDAGLRVSSLCRGGFLTGDDRDAALDENRRAIDEAAALGTSTLVLVVGGLPPGSRDLAAARERVADGVAALAPYAAAAGVRLALEPMHPIYCADRGVLSTLDQALDLALRFPAAQVGVVVDTFHVWWDPRVEAAIARAGDRIAAYQVCDWILPLPPDALLARGLPGDGYIDFRTLGAAVARAGYRGDVEVEVFHADVWAAPFDQVVSEVVHRYAEHVAPTG